MTNETGESLMITSTKNEKVKWVRSLQSTAHKRRAEGVIVVEGVRLAEEALQAGWQGEWVLYSDELSERGRAVVDAFARRGTMVEQAVPDVLRAAADTQTPQGIVVVLQQQTLPLPPALDFILIPDGVSDPGNLGTMLRTAAAAGVQAVLCPPQTADAFAPKVLRAGMGAQFRLPVHCLDWEEIAAIVRPLAVYIAEIEAGKTYFDQDFRLPLALVVGSEAEGARPEARRLASGYVCIPMPGGSESLNAAVAAGILLFEVVRQRR